jgi:hypothetical protein
MTRFVVDCGAVLHLVSEGISVPSQHELLAPTLLRSQTLSTLHEAVQRGGLPSDVALDRLSRIKAMPIRLLGDAVLRTRVARRSATVRSGPPGSSGVPLVGTAAASVNGCSQTSNAVPVADLVVASPVGDGGETGRSNIVRSCHRLDVLGVPLGRSRGLADQQYPGDQAPPTRVTALPLTIIPHPDGWTRATSSSPPPRNTRARPSPPSSSPPT